MQLGVHCFLASSLLEYMSYFNERSSEINYLLLVTCFSLLQGQIVVPRKNRRENRSDAQTKMYHILTFLRCTSRSPSSLRRYVFGKDKTVGLIIPTRIRARMRIGTGMFCA